jgi:zinc transporter ZupT
MEPNTTLLLTKLGTSILIFIICLGGGLIPLRLVSGGGSRGGSGGVQTALSYGNCFGGGVLLGVAMVHLLVDSESVEDKDGSASGSASGNHDEDPMMVEKAHSLPHLMAAVGFLIAFILERVAFAHSHGHDLEALGAPKGDIELKNIEQAHLVSSASPDDDVENAGGNHHDHKKPKKHSHDHHDEGDDHEAEGEKGHGHGNGHGHGHKEKHDEEEEEHGHGHEDEESEGAHLHEHEHEHGHSDHAKEGHLHHAVHHEHGHGHTDEKPPLPYLLFSVLALESFVTGSALGIQEDRTKVTFTFFAIASHIWAEAFTLTINLLKSNFSVRKVAWLMTGFAAITPLSALCGVGMEKVLSGEVVVTVTQILVAVAAGIFLYVAIIEIMVEEFHSQAKKWQKLTLLLTGFVFVSAVGFF